VQRNVSAPALIGQIAVSGLRDHHPGLKPPGQTQERRILRWGRRLARNIVNLNPEEVANAVGKEAPVMPCSTMSPSSSPVSRPRKTRRTIEMATWGYMPGE